METSKLFSRVAVVVFALSFAVQANANPAILIGAGMGLSAGVCAFFGNLVRKFTTPDVKPGFFKAGYETVKGAVAAHPVIAGAVATAAVAGGVAYKMLGKKSEVKSVAPAQAPVAPKASKQVKVGRFDKGAATKFVAALTAYVNSDAVEFGSDITGNKFANEFASELAYMKKQKAWLQKVKATSQRNGIKIDLSDKVNIIAESLKVVAAR